MTREPTSCMRWWRRPGRRVLLTRPIGGRAPVGTWPAGTWWLTTQPDIANRQATKRVLWSWPDLECRRHSRTTSNSLLRYNAQQRRRSCGTPTARLRPREHRLQRQRRPDSYSDAYGYTTRHVHDANADSTATATATATSTPLNAYASVRHTPTQAQPTIRPRCSANWNS